MKFFQLPMFLLFPRRRVQKTGPAQLKLLSTRRLCLLLLSAVIDLIKAILYGILICEVTQPFDTLITYSMTKISYRSRNLIGMTQSDGTIGNVIPYFQIEKVSTGQLHSDLRFVFVLIFSQLSLVSH